MTPLARAEARIAQMEALLQRALEEIAVGHDSGVRGCRGCQLRADIAAELRKGE